MCVCVCVCSITPDPGVYTACSQESPALNTGSQRADWLSWPQLGVRRQTATV